MKKQLIVDAMDDKKYYTLLEKGKGAAFRLLAVTAIALSLCCCKSSSSSVTESNRDSVVVSVRTEVEYVPDTVLVDIPSQTAERTTIDSVSHLENDYALSDAHVNADGTLYHSLKTRPQKKPVEVLKPVEHKDSIVYVNKVVTRIKKQIVEVEKKRTWYDQARIYGFYVIVILLVISYRKQIGRLFIKLIMKL